MTLIPAALAEASTLMPVCGSAGSISRTFTPSEIIDCAIDTNFALSPCAFWMSAFTPAASNAFFSRGASYCVYRAEEVVSGRITPTCTLLLSAALVPELEGLPLSDEPPQALSAARPASATSAPPVIRTRDPTVVLSTGSCRRGHELLPRTMARGPHIRQGTRRKTDSNRRFLPDS